MATSSITKHFLIDKNEQAEKFANAVEESYQESLLKRNKSYNLVNLYGNEEDMNKLIKRCSIK